MVPTTVLLSSIAVVVVIGFLVLVRRNRTTHLVVVSDTSVITNLANIGHLFLLRRLYRGIVVPPHVWTEMRRIVPRNRGIISIWLAWWIRCVAVQQLQAVEHLLRADAALDQGEAEAIILAEELQASLLLIDEAHGRRVAEQRGLVIRGLLGVLLEAKQRGFVRSIKPLIDRLRKQHGFRMSDELYRRVLRQAGE